MGFFDKFKKKDQQVFERYSEFENHILSGNWEQLRKLAEKRLAEEGENPFLLLMISMSDFYSFSHKKSHERSLLIEEASKKHRELAKKFDLEYTANTFLEWVKGFSKRHPKNQNVMVLLGAAYVGNDRYKDGIKTFKKAIKINPDLPEAAQELCSAYRDLGKYREAVEWGKRAVQLDPKYADAHLVLGKVYFFQKEFEKALVEFQKAVELDPESSNAWSDLSGIKKELNRPEEAIHAAKKALTINPENQDALINLANAQVDTENIDKAIKNYRQVLQINPENLLALHNLGLALSVKGDYNEAIKTYERLLNIQGSDPSLNLEAYKQKITELKEKKNPKITH